MSERKRFRINIEDSVVFTAADLWPDGDAPENPTEADVVELIRTHGGAEAIVRDWMGFRLRAEVAEVDSPVEGVGRE